MHPDERPTPRRVAGLLAGFGGVLAVLGLWRRRRDRRPAHVPRRRHPLRDRVPVHAPVRSRAARRRDKVSLDPVLAMLARGALGTGFAYILNDAVVRLAWPPRLHVTYLVPLV
jgi:drug/metabolite transporter (DMT)-like permease